METVSTHKSHHKNAILRKTLIAVLCVLCAGSFIWFIYSIRSYYMAGDLRPEYHRQMDLQPRENIPVTSIKTWMTFDYLNIVFQLNPSYLKTKLNITDPRYPNVRIDAYARHYHLNRTTLLLNIQQLITAISK